LRQLEAESASIVFRPGGGFVPLELFQCVSKVCVALKLKINARKENKTKPCS